MEGLPVIVLAWCSVALPVVLKGFSCIWKFGRKGNNMMIVFGGEKMQEHWARKPELGILVLASSSYLIPAVWTLDRLQLLDVFGICFVFLMVATFT